MKKILKKKKKIMMMVVSFEFEWKKKKKKLHEMGKGLQGRRETDHQRDGRRYSFHC